MFIVAKASPASSTRSEERKKRRPGECPESRSIPNPAILAIYRSAIHDPVAQIPRAIRHETREKREGSADRRIRRRIARSTRQIGQLQTVGENRHIPTLGELQRRARMIEMAVREVIASGGEPAPNRASPPSKTCAARPGKPESIKTHGPPNAQRISIHKTDRLPADIGAIRSIAFMKERQQDQTKLAPLPAKSSEIFRQGITSLLPWLEIAWFRENVRIGIENFLPAGELL